MVTRKINDIEQRLCYNKLIRCESRRERSQVLRHLAKKHGCSHSTIIRAAERENGDRLLPDPGTIIVISDDEDEPQAPRLPRRITRPQAKPHNCASAPSTTQCANIADSSPRSSQPVSDSNPLSIPKPPSPYYTSAVDVTQFLSLLGLSKLVPFFRAHGFTSQKDLKDLKAFPTRTQEMILKSLLENRSMSLKEFGVIHAALSSM